MTTSLKTAWKLWEKAEKSWESGKPERSEERRDRDRGPQAAPVAAAEPVVTDVPAVVEPIEVTETPEPEPVVDAVAGEPVEIEEVRTKSKKVAEAPEPEPAVEVAAAEPVSEAVEASPAPEPEPATEAAPEAPEGKKKRATKPAAE